jgi:hypothetical protein
MNAESATTTETGAARGSSVVLPGQSPDGGYILSVLLKRSFDIVPAGTCRRSAKDMALFPGDVYWGDPMNSTIRYESDFIPFKLATDVVLNGTAYAPDGVPVSSCLVSLQVEGSGKQILVIGDRVARYMKDRAPVFSEPVPFETMELRYERAYGGIDVFTDKMTPYPYPRNPLGCGFVVANTGKGVDNRSLPNLEDPNALLAPEILCRGEYAQWEQYPYPAGFGWVPKTWLPRARLAGILPADRATEQELRQAYAQLIPAGRQRENYLQHGLPDMDFGFFNGAAPGLTFPFLKGGERITTENLHPDGLVSFTLPEETPKLGLDIGFGIQEPPVVLHTVMIRMDEQQVDLVWRGAVPYEGPDWFPQMRKMEVHIG